MLNFDFTFLAILLSDAQEPECESCRCAAHPCKAQCVMAHTVALETAADHSLVLAWWQLRDHIDDHGFFKAIPYRLAALLLRGAYRKARTFVPEFDASVQRHLNDLHEREREHCASLDQAAEPFAALMADIADCVDDEMRRRVMKEIFYHLGRWIYLVDAADDFEKDAHSNCYNPLRYRYELDGDKLNEQSRAAVAASLDLSVAPHGERLRAALLRRVDKYFRQHFLREPLPGRQCRSQGPRIISPRAEYTSASRRRKTRKPYE